jgi:phospholipid/cholesterol/gamma-HCH transport system substrate-binding protein
MERNAHYASIGLTTIALLIAMALFVVWLARFQFNKEYDLYDVLFYGPVRGLSEGGEVHFNGIKVGEVTDLNLDTANPNRVVARVRVNADVPVRTDSRAALEPQGITGVNYVQITAGNPRRPLLKSQYPDDAVPVIQSQPGVLSELLEGGGTVLARAVDTLNRVNRVLSDENIRSFGSTMQNVEDVSAELRARRSIIAKAETAIENASAAAAEITELSRSGRSLVEGDGKAAIANAADAAEEIEATATDLRAMVSRLQGPTSDFAATGLPQLTAAAVSLQEAAEALTVLVREAQSSPQGFISRPKSREVEVQP